MSVLSRYDNIKIRAYLYPNPPFVGETLTSIWGDEYHMKNEPFLEFVLCSLPQGRYSLEILSPVQLEQAFEADSAQATLFFLDQELADPMLSEIYVRLREGKKTLAEFAIPLSVHKLTGQVRDFNDRPFPAYLWACRLKPGRPETMVRTDSEGRFTLYYPQGKPLWVFIDDESYARTTYECWITAEELKDDVEINPRIGDFELWGLHAWRTQLAWQVYFWPCSLPLDLRAKRSGWKHRYNPRLTKEEIAVRIGGEEVPIKGMHRVRVWAGREKDYHPIYLLELPPQVRDPCSPELIKVEVHTKRLGRGEAWYIAW